MTDDTMAPPPEDPKLRGPQKTEIKGAKPRGGLGKGMPDMDPVGIDPESAFAILMTMDPKTTLPQLTAELKKRRIKISGSTLTKWAARFNWTARREMALEGLDPGRIHLHLMQIMKLAELPTEEVMQGAINSLTQVVIDATRTKPPEHARVLCDILKDMIDMKGHVRAVLMPLEPTKAEDNPVAQKKANGKNGANGHGSDPLDFGSFRDRVVDGGSGG